ncbi:MAG: hypothetical protein CMF50_04980 [Legionellales bacterium]|nr:hypothetical protein [Legionellales bacterium]|tara:strand:- start:41638 stop:43011 length:1374 start_codon:yes stop_codon:yes gene_type:complete
MMYNTHNGYLELFCAFLNINENESGLSIKEAGDDIVITGDKTRLRTLRAVLETSGALKASLTYKLSEPDTAESSEIFIAAVAVTGKAASLKINKQALHDHLNKTFPEGFVLYQQSAGGENEVKPIIFRAPESQKPKTIRLVIDVSQHMAIGFAAYKQKIKALLNSLRSKLGTDNPNVIITPFAASRLKSLVCQLKDQEKIDKFIAGLQAEGEARLKSAVYKTLLEHVKNQENVSEGNLYIVFSGGRNNFEMVRGNFESGNWRSNTQALTARLGAMKMPTRCYLLDVSNGRASSDALEELKGITCGQRVNVRENNNFTQLVDEMSEAPRTVVIRQKQASMSSVVPDGAVVDSGMRLSMDKPFTVNGVTYNATSQEPTLPEVKAEESHKEVAASSRQMTQRNSFWSLHPASLFRFSFLSLSFATAAAGLLAALFAPTQAEQVHGAVAQMLESFMGGPKR